MAKQKAPTIPSNSPLYEGHRWIYLPLLASVLLSSVVTLLITWVFSSCR